MNNNTKKDPWDKIKCPISGLVWLSVGLGLMAKLGEGLSLGAFISIEVALFIGAVAMLVKILLILEE